MWSLVLTLIAVVGVAQAQNCTPSSVSSTNAIIQRPKTTPDKPFIYIAGLFGLHSSAPGGNNCDKLQTDGVQHLLAFLYAIDTAKSQVAAVDSDFGLGGIVFDTCKSNAVAIQNLMNFEKCTIGFGNPAVLPSYTFGYVGPDRGFVHDTAPVIASFRETQISFCQMEDSYNDQMMYPYLFRTGPSVSKSMAAMFSVISAMKYTVVQFVYTNNIRGMNGRTMFDMMATQKGVCVESFIAVAENASDATSYDNAIVQLMQQPSVHAVVLWLDPPVDEGSFSQTAALLQAAKQRYAMDSFYWISAYITRLNLTDLDHYAEGAVNVEPISTQSTNFITYFQGLKPDGQQQIFRDWWMMQFNCDLPESTARTINGVPKPCDLSKQSLAGMQVSNKVGFIIEAVYALVKGIKSASDARCFNQAAFCNGFMLGADRQYLIHDQIAQLPATFNAQTGEPVLASYVYINIQRPSVTLPTLLFQQVGSYAQANNDAPLVNLDGKNVYVYDSRGVRMDNPLSFCPFGSCLKCAMTTTTQQTGNTTPSSNMSTTSAAPVVFRPYSLVRREKQWIIPLMVLAGVGIFITICFEVYILSRLIGTKMAKQFRTMWLGQLLLVAILISYVLLFAFVPSPSEATCGIIRFGIGTCYASMFAVLLVKLMIILSSKTIGYLKGVYQVLMFLFAYGMQVVIDVEWLILVHPSAGWNDTANEWQCTDIHYNSHLQSLVYVMFLILICTLIAARTHGIITNHREGIFIGLSAGFSIPIWIAWTLIGSLNTNKDFEEPSLAYGLLINTTLILFTMFLPKVRQLNTMGVEGIYLEDDGVDNEAYGSVIYGPPSYQSRMGSVYQVNGTHGSLMGGPPTVQLVPKNQILYDQQPMYIRGPSSVRSMPIYASPNRAGSTISKTLRVTGDLTGRYPIERKSASEYAYKGRPDSKSGSIKRSGSLTDLGAL